MSVTTTPGSPQVSFVTGQLRPGHVLYPILEGLGRSEGEGGLVIVAFFGGRCWWGTVVSHRRAIYNQDHSLLQPLHSIYPNLSSRRVGSVTGGWELSTQGGLHYCVVGLR